MWWKILAIASIATLGVGAVWASGQDSASPDVAPIAVSDDEVIRPEESSEQTDDDAGDDDTGDGDGTTGNDGTGGGDNTGDATRGDTT